mmetsp:Transcript_4534/g.6839  ORF Transcript_4534/g.6839 Transcript_4534/m.6839 type:complete len:108 (+) Transcript_4534:731-1054(+)
MIKEEPPKKESSAASQSGKKSNKKRTLEQFAKQVPLGDLAPSKLPDGTESKKRRKLNEAPPMPEFLQRSLEAANASAPNGRNTSKDKKGNEASGRGDRGNQRASEEA